MEGPPRQKGRCRAGQQAGTGTHAKVDRSTDSNRLGLVPEEPTRVRLRDRPLDESACARPHPKAVRRHVPFELSVPLALRTPNHPAEAQTTSQAARPSSHPSVDSRRLDSPGKNGAQENAHIVLVDETSCMLAPMVRRTVCASEAGH